MQKEPAPSRSPSFQQASTLLPTPTVPPPDPPCDGHEPSHNHSPAEQAMEEEFQFLRCQGCQTQAKCPKLLPCLHTLCSGCLEAPSLQCPICQAPRSPDGDAQALDNVFFESLQRRLSVYRQMVDQRALCTRCKERADFWCFECEQLLCVKCFEAHQWFLKHEARPVAELRSQSVREFLDGTRKSNNIFCSNSNHRSPAQISIYCRGCCKPLCCTCALLDRRHSDLQCDISSEIQRRQEELGTMTQELQEQGGAFQRAHAQMGSALGQLSQQRADTEELIRSRMRQVVAHVQAKERELLDALSSKYQLDYEQMAGHLGRLDAVLQRIQTGGALVKRMKLYASDQEVMFMHDFLRQALGRLRQEKPQGLQAPVPTSGFQEFKVRLQDFISCITQATDAAVSRRPSPAAVSTSGESFDVELPSEVQRTQNQALELTETQPVAVVQSVPGVHPVPMYAFSIKSPSYREEASQTPTLMKRKSCQTQCSRKMIKMETEEERLARLAPSSPEQPRPSTSKALSPPHLDGPSSPESPIIEKEVIPPTSNHVTSNTKEAEERIVVISSSEDSDTENSCAEPSETAEPPSWPPHSLLRGRKTSRPRWACSRPRGGGSTCRSQAWTPFHPTEQAATPDPGSPSKPTGHQERTAILRGNRVCSRRAPGVTRLHHILRVSSHEIMPPHRSHPVIQAAAPATIGAPRFPADGQAYPARLQRVLSASRRRCRAGCLRTGSPHLRQWLDHFFALPISTASQLTATSTGGAYVGAPSKGPMENP
uniref:protein PML isoform X4 n=1 Tax=Jaculus jaculus TaxID=51337 RepID=UPI001E1B2294|nr:protein PML isoform X4 [Jaculus jaculus]